MEDSPVSEDLQPVPDTFCEGRRSGWLCVLRRLDDQGRGGAGSRATAGLGGEAFGKHLLLPIEACREATKGLCKEVVADTNMGNGYLDEGDLEERKVSGEIFSDSSCCAPTGEVPALATVLRLQLVQLLQNSRE